MPCDRLRGAARKVLASAGDAIDRQHWERVVKGIEMLVDAQATIGESPTWSAGEQAFYWIDIKQPALHRRDADGGTRCWRMDADIGAFALLKDAVGAVVALRTGLFRLDFQTGAMTLLAHSPIRSGAVSLQRRHLRCGG